MPGPYQTSGNMDTAMLLALSEIELNSRIEKAASASLVGACSMLRIASAASTNATVVKASPGKVYGILASNTNVAARFLKLYNKATTPVVGTDTPILTLPLAATNGQLPNLPVPIPFSIGISYALTLGIADTDVLAVALNDVHGMILFA